jgi:hypothetical protein
MHHCFSDVRGFKRQRRAAVLLWLLIFLIAAPLSEAQSGRRPPKQPTSPDPLPPKNEEPPIKPPSEQNSAPKIPVKVVWQLSHIGSSSIYSRTVQEACLERLSKSGSVTPGAARDEMNRKQAIDLAKGSSDTYVVWFELELDPQYQDRGGISNVPPQYLTVRFELYTPGTGKTKTGGNVYQRPQGPGGLPLPVPGTAGTAGYSLAYAGREMADRVLDALGVGRPH